jgi:hypothetical protein
MVQLEKVTVPLTVFCKVVCHMQGLLPSSSVLGFRNNDHQLGSQNVSMLLQAGAAAPMPDTFVNFIRMRSVYL